MSRKPNVEAREKILKAALSIMRERGFNAVSMDEVAKAAGIKKANLFHYFPTKEALGLAVFDFAAACVREDVRLQLSRGQDPIRKVSAMFTALEKSMDERRCRGGCPIGNLAMELSDQYERIRRRIAAYFQEWTGEVAASLERGREEGYFRRELKAQEAAEAILSLFEGATLMCKARKDVAPLENARDMAVEYLRGYKR